mgnify:CR=1 FL=1
MAKQNHSDYLTDLDLSKLQVKENDKATRKLLMLVEGTYGIGVKKSIEKYGYTEQRYYQLKKEFKKEGFKALADDKRGPKKNYARKKNIIMQIIRMRFVDPKASASVISQKLNQSGFKISQRSVERTITEYGIQKKTL